MGETRETGGAAEIRELERKLEEKKRQLAERGEAIPGEKEVFRQVLREHMRPASPPPTPVPQKGEERGETRGASPKANAPSEEMLGALVELALTGTISDAVRAAEQKSPYLLDTLHDRLVDEYYEKLVRARKLKEL